MPDPTIFVALSLLGLVPIVYLLVNAALSRRHRDPVRGPSVPPSEVTIVIPVYQQRPDLFEACLESAAGQGSPIVVVGDASLEPYRTVARRWSADFVYLAEHSGKKKALAAGLARVSTPFVLFLDSDSRLPPNAVADLSSHFVEGVGGVGANLTVRDTGRWAAAGGEFVERAREVVLKAMSTRGSVLYLDGACLLLRTDLVRDFVRSEEFQGLKVLGRPSRLGDDWLLTDFLLRQGLRTVKAYEVLVVTEPPARLTGFVRQNVRWARSNWIRLGSYLRLGLPRTAGRLYAFEVAGTYLLPLVALVTLFSRVPLVLHALSVDSTHAWTALVLFVGLPIHRISWTSVSRVAITLAESFSTGMFVGVAVRSRSTGRARLLAGGALALAVMFAASVYGLATFWKPARWTGDSEAIAEGPAIPAGADRANPPTAPVAP